MRNSVCSPLPPLFSDTMRLHRTYAQYARPVTCTQQLKQAAVSPATTTTTKPLNLYVVVAVKGLARLILNQIEAFCANRTGRASCLH